MFWTVLQKLRLGYIQNSDSSIYLVEEQELSLGERVHLASKDLRKILNPSIVAALVGLGIIGLVTLSTFHASSTLNEYGYHQYRLNSADGPICDPSDKMVSDDADPAKIVVLNGYGADKAGLKNGDVVEQINNITISNAGEFSNWRNLIPGVKPGDVVQVKAIRDGQELSFKVQTSSSPSNSTIPLIGLLVPKTCDEYYFLNDKEKSLTLESIRYIDSMLGNIRIAVIAFAAIFGYFLIWTLWKGRKLKADVDAWEEAYLDQYYILTFETTKPSGSSNGEKIFNLAQTVFPELRKKDRKQEKWKGKMEGKDGYEFDCFQTTNESEPRLFVVKHFGKEKVDLEKLQELCDMAKKGKSAKTLKDKIKKLNDSTKFFRVICVAENYDAKFLNDRSLEEVMDKLDFEDPIDLILEKDGNYSVLWTEI